MRISHWPDDSAPVMVDCTSQELTELLGKRPDTLRGAFYEDRKDVYILAIASGYGNTHSSITSAVKKVIPRIRSHDEFIINFNTGNEPEIDIGVNGHYIRISKMMYDADYSEFKWLLIRIFDWWMAI